VTEASQHTSIMWVLPAVLSVTAGAVDVIGFLGLGGLFTAHITGNIVVLGAHYATGGFSRVGPLLSVPVFIAVLGAVTLVFEPVRDVRSFRHGLPLLQAALLAFFFGAVVAFGPLNDPNSAVAVFAGLPGVAAMATQNALVRFALPGSPSTGVLTTNTTQLAINLTKLVTARKESVEIASLRRRAGVLFSCVAGFVAGGAIGAFLEVRFHLFALVLPIVPAAIAIPLGDLWIDVPLPNDRQTQATRPKPIHPTSYEQEGRYDRHLMTSQQRACGRKPIVLAR
jgi:uncharacterized membrane protein YoaK (UPF0700 family)